MATLGTYLAKPLMQWYSSGNDQSMGNAITDTNSERIV